MKLHHWEDWETWDEVACPWCGVFHDLSDFDFVLKVGDKPVFECSLEDKAGTELGCGNKFEVVQVAHPVLLRVRAVTASDARGFSHVQTDEERAEFERSATWRGMQAKKKAD